MNLGLKNKKVSNYFRRKQCIHFNLNFPHMDFCISNQLCRRLAVKSHLLSFNLKKI